MNLKISVVVSTYNAPGMLTRVLDAYLIQSRMPDELIVADDGSGDETRHIIERFSANAPFHVKHAWHEDDGFRAAKIRNEAIKLSAGDYIIFTDGDCIPHPRFVEDHEVHAEDGYFVQGKRMLVGERLSPRFVWKGTLHALALSYRGQISGAHRLLRLRWLVSRNTNTRGIRSCNLALFTDDLLAVNGYNEDFVGWGREDSELVARLYKYGLRRKDPLFSAMVFHLWHPLQSRDSLQHNDELLRNATAGNDYRCSKGITRG